MTEAEQGSHSELGHSAKRKKPDSRDGRSTHRPAVSPPADDICQLVTLRYGMYCGQYSTVMVRWQCIKFEFPHSTIYLSLY